MPLTLEYSRQTTRFLDKLERANKAAWRRVWARVEFLTHTPKPPQAARVAGYTAEIYRVRVGNYRIIYTYTEKTLNIGIVAHRKDVYQTLQTQIQNKTWHP